MTGGIVWVAEPASLLPESTLKKENDNGIL